MTRRASWSLILIALSGLLLLLALHRGYRKLEAIRHVEATKAQKN